MKTQHGTMKRMGSAVLILALAVFIFSPAGRLMGWGQDVLSINDLFAQIGTRVAAFGGLYVDPDKDTVYVYMVPGQAGSVTELNEAIDEVLGSNRPPGSLVVTVPGQYTFLQLKEWQDASDPELLSMLGVVSTGIHNTTNRLQVGVATPQARALVLSELATLGIPVEAVEVVDQAPLQEEQAAACTNIRNICRPLVGGLQIRYRKANNNIATATFGFSATRNGVPGFVTCSHCEGVRFLNTGTIQFQNAIGNARIGQEIANPRLTGALGAGFQCPLDGNGNPNHCRLTETSFVKYDEGMNVKVGYIARPGENITGQSCNVNLQLCAWNGNASFRITGYRISYEGEIVGKVGRTTGLTLGKVTRPCVNDVSGNAVLVCQVEANYLSLPGDSGAPVFGCPNGGKKGGSCYFVGPDVAPINVQLLGTHWAGLPGGVGGPGLRSYSNVVLTTNPVSELGTLTKFCAPDVYNPSCN